MTRRRTTGAVTPVRARRTTTLLAAAVLPLAVSACGSNLDPQTYRERTTQDAANTQVGALALRNVAIEPPAAGQSELAIGADAQATLAVVSTSTEKDALTAVSSPAASATELVDGSGHAVTSVEIPANGTAGFGDFGVVLRGLTKALRPGMYVEMTFSFRNNGRATFKVPVAVYDNPVPRASFAPKEHEAE
jgi:copper(I)-binding protein